MGEAFIVRRGGGSSVKLFAVIAVTYPEGSDCTCTNGEKVLKAKDTSGRALFSVSIGTWVVSCTDGTDTASKIVTISEDGEAKIVELNYNLMLYDSGNQYTSVTGGWQKTGSGGSVDFDTSSMTVKANAYQKNTNAVTKNGINLNNVKTLHFLVRSETTYATGYPRVGISTSDNPIASQSDNYVASKTLSASSSYTDVTLDVSSIMGSFYVSIGGQNGDAGTATIDVQRVWGEYA